MRQIPGAHRRPGRAPHLRASRDRTSSAHVSESEREASARRAQGAPRCCAHPRLLPAPQAAAPGSPARSRCRSRQLQRPCDVAAPPALRHASARGGSRAGSICAASSGRTTLLRSSTIVTSSSGCCTGFAGPLAPPGPAAAAGAAMRRAGAACVPPGVSARTRAAWLVRFGHTPREQRAAAAGHEAAARTGAAAARAHAPWRRKGTGSCSGEGKRKQSAGRGRKCCALYRERTAGCARHASACETAVGVVSLDMLIHAARCMPSRLREELIRALRVCCGSAAARATGSRA